jgi:RNA polymerase sigma-B factor
MSDARSVQDTRRRARNQELVARLATADAVQRERLLEELVVTNVAMARSIARRYAGRSEFAPDLEQVAQVALVKAARDFDATRGHEFLAYAIPCMTGAVKHFFRDSAWVVRPPRKVQQRHVAEHGAAEHVADGVRVESCFRPWSLDAPVLGDGEPLGTTLVDVGDRSWDRAEDSLLLWQHLRALTPQAQRIIHLRFFEDRTQQQIADELGVTQVHVSRLLSRHLGELRELMTEAA